MIFTEQQIQESIEKLNGFGEEKVKDMLINGQLAKNSPEHEVALEWLKMKAKVRGSQLGGTQDAEQIAADINNQLNVMTKVVKMQTKQHIRWILLGVVAILIMATVSMFKSWLVN